MAKDAPDDLGFGDFFAGLDDQGLSLEELSQSYAQLIEGGSDPYDGTQSPDDPAAETEASEKPDLEALVLEPPPDDACEISPRSILEALLFVGHPENRPLTARMVAGLMRGVSPREIDELVSDLNSQYAAEGCPYFIASVDAGYRLQLHDAFGSIRDKFYGRVKESRLNQAAIDTLAIVAYKQGVTRDEIEKLRGKPAGAVLSQLVRRELLMVKRTEDNPREPRYYTTERFLDLFDLDSLESLPETREDV